MERKEESFITAALQLTFRRVGQLMEEGLSRTEAVRRVRAEIGLGVSTTWPGHEVVENLRMLAFDGIRPNIDKVGGSTYKTK